MTPSPFKNEVFLPWLSLLPNKMLSRSLFTHSITKAWVCSGCSGQLKLATVLEFSQYNRSDSLGVKPPLY